MAIACYSASMCHWENAKMAGKIHVDYGAMHPKFFFPNKRNLPAVKENHTIHQKVK